MEKFLNNSKQQTKVPEGGLEIFLSRAVSFSAPLRTRIPADQLPSGMQNGTHCILMTADDGATSTRLKLHCYTWQMGRGGGVGVGWCRLEGKDLSLFCCRPQKSEQFINGVWMPCWSFPDTNKKNRKVSSTYRTKTERKKPCMSSMQDSPITHFFKK